MRDFDEYNVLLDHFHTKKKKDHHGIIAISNVIECSECGGNEKFIAMFLHDDKWICMNCWENMGHKMSENMREKLNESTQYAYRNFAIKNMNVLHK